MQRTQNTLAHFFSFKNISKKWKSSIKSDFAYKMYV